MKGGAGCRITFSGGGSNDIAERARRLARISPPVQPVLLARRTAEFLRVLQDLVTVVVDSVVVALRIADGEARLDREQLVASDASVDDLFESRRRVEDPTVVGFNQRNGQRQSSFPTTSTFAPSSRVVSSCFASYNCRKSPRRFLSETESSDLKRRSEPFPNSAVRPF